MELKKYLNTHCLIALKYLIPFYLVIFFLIPSGYHIANVATLLLSTIIFITSTARFSLDRNTKLVILCFLIWFGLIAFSVTLGKTSARYIDRPSRCLPYLFLLLISSNISFSINKLCKYLNFTVIILACICVYKYFNGHLRPTVYVNVNLFAACITFCLGFIFYSLFILKDKMAIFAIAASLILVFLSGCRIAILSLFLLIPLNLFFYFNNANKKILYSLAIIFILSLIILSLLPQTQSRFGLIQEEVVKYYFQSKSTTITPSFIETSIGIRLLHWKLAIAAFLVDPIFGSGSDFIYQELNNYVKSGISNRIMGFHLHSDYFDSLGIFGLTGLFSMLAFYFSIFLLAIKKYKSSVHLSKILISLVLAAMIFGLTDSVFRTSTPLFSFIFLSFLLAGQINLNSKNFAKVKI